jgi:hypothetical protein
MSGKEKLALVACIVCTLCMSMNRVGSAGGFLFAGQSLCSRRVCLYSCDECRRGLGSKYSLSIPQTLDVFLCFVFRIKFHLSSPYATTASHHIPGRIVLIIGCYDRNLICFAGSCFIESVRFNGQMAERSKAPA